MASDTAFRKVSCRLEETCSSFVLNLNLTLNLNPLGLSPGAVDPDSEGIKIKIRIKELRGGSGNGNLWTGRRLSGRDGAGVAFVFWG